MMIISALADNYIYLIRWDNYAAVIDPGEAAPVITVLNENNLQLKYILNTHHHYDHIDGNDELHTFSDAILIGPDDSRIPHLKQTVKEDDSLSIGPYTFQVFEVRGHTASHIVYHEPAQKWLFSGDTLFGAGCGRLFEGTAEEMFFSLNKLKQLSEDTLIFCGHEYTLENLKFALTVEPENRQIQQRYQETLKMRKKRIPTVPSTLKLELETNVFLRAKTPKELARLRHLKETKTF